MLAETLFAAWTWIHDGGLQVFWKAESTSQYRHQHITMAVPRSRIVDLMKVSFA
jgi:hypothetical protein